MTTLVQAGIPLFNKHGDVVAMSRIDAVDCEWLSATRWYLHPGRYARRRSGALSIFMHREILGLDWGEADHTDHMNGDTLDNRRSNVRVVPGPAGNLQNRPHGGNRGSTSRFRGVSWDTRCEKWVASASLAGKFYFLGRYADEGLAAQVASQWRAEHMPYSIEDALL